MEPQYVRPPEARMVRSALAYMPRVLSLLAETQSAAEAPRKQAELQLRELYSNEGTRQVLSPRRP